MHAPQTIAIAAPRSADEKATWALIALVAVLVAGGAGWLVARESAPTWGDVESSSRMAAHEGAMQGRDRGYSQGARSGRKEAQLGVDYQAARAGRGAYNEGWQKGFQDGRDRAAASRMYADDITPWIGSGSSVGAYPSTGFEDLQLSGDLLTDVPGYATSSLSGTGAYDTPGYQAPLAGSTLSDLYRGGSSY